VTILNFLKPTDSILFKQRDKSSPLNFTQCALLPPQHRDRTVITNYCEITSPYV